MCASPRTCSQVSSSELDRIALTKQITNGPQEGIHVYSHSKRLSVVLTIFLALISACSSRQLPKASVETRTNEAQQQQNPKVIAAIVRAKKANLRDRPSQLATVVGTVNRGDLLSLTTAESIGPWYRIRDTKTGADGWIHGNTISLLQAAEANSSSSTSAQEQRSTETPIQRLQKVSPPASTSSPDAPGSSHSASGRSYVNVDGIRVPSPVFSDTRPTGASARCRDGSYSFSLHRRGTCSHHGGVAEWY